MNLFADSIIPFRRETTGASITPILPGDHLNGIVFVFRLLRDGTYCAAAASDAFCSLYRVNRHVLRNNAQPVFDAVHPDDLDGFVASILESARSMSPWQHEYRLRFPDGVEHLISGNALPSFTEQGNVVWNGFLVDVTARRDSAARAEAWARHSELLMRTTTDGIHILDAEGFLLEANDAFGRMLGRDPGQMLGMHVSDWNVEWEGHTLRKRFADPAGPRSQGEVVGTRFRRVDGRLIDVQTSTTTAVVGGSLRFYCSSRDVTHDHGNIADDAGRETDRAFEADMLRGMHNDEFVLYFQPQRERENIVGAELLVRWKHPVRGLLTPAAFIAQAEKGDLIITLGNWVLERACLQLVEWATDPLTAPLSLSVNVSARQFRQPDFLPGISSVLARTGANPARLTIELTESLLIDNVEETISKMQALRKMGICCALDDFGVCYSSLTYLKNLPFAEMKIDQAFIHDVFAEPKNAAIVRAIIVLGDSLGLTVVAEGVETEDQRSFLAEHGCTRQQGYLLGHPVPLAEFSSALPWHD